MRTLRTRPLTPALILLLTLSLVLLLSPSSIPASASHGEPDWLDFRGSVDGTFEPMPDLHSPFSRQGQGEMLTNFENAKWIVRASGSGTCTEIVLDAVFTYPPRPGDWAKARGIAKADDAVHNFCTSGTRSFHGTVRVLGGGGNYAKAEGVLSFTGLVIGDGPTSREAFHMDSTGSLRCYHVLP